MKGDVLAIDPSLTEFEMTLSNTGRIGDHVSPTNTLKTRLQRQAKALRRAGLGNHLELLNGLVAKLGYRTWDRFCELVDQANRHDTGRRLVTVTELLVNPELPNKFYNTPNYYRSEDELAAWFERPYLVMSDEKAAIYCLDGRVWDRPDLSTLKSSRIMIKTARLSSTRKTSGKHTGCAS